MLDATSLAVYMYGRHGTLVEMLRFGPAIPDIPHTNDLRGSDLLVLRLTSETKGRVIVSEVRDHERPTSDPYSVIGFVVIYRSSGIYGTEAEDVDEVMPYVGSEISRRLQLIANARSHEARRKIAMVCHGESRTGTKIAAVIRHMQNGSEASYIGFGVIQESNIRLLYMRRPHDEGDAKYVMLEPTFPLSSSLKQVLAGGEIASLEANSDRINAARILGLRPYQAADLRFYVAAAASDGEAMSSFVLAVSSRAATSADIGLLGLASFTIDELRLDIERLYAHMNNRVIVNPVFRGRHTEIEEKEVFVLMPFHENWSAQIWQQLVRPVCEAQGFAARRADDFYGSVLIEDIWRGICRARIIIADITNRNPNVFYELGIAHTMGKDVILITQKLEDVPADLRHHRFIVYENSVGGYAPFERALANTLRDLTSL